MAEEVAVMLKGEIDHHRTEEIKRQLDEIIENTRPLRMILDFKNVTMMDSSGVGLILGRYKRLSERGGALYVKRLSKQVDLVFQVSGLYQVIKKI